MTTKHTPKPWKANVHDILDGAGRVLFQISPEASAVICFGEAWANSHLGAAAPELLEALKGVADNADCPNTDSDGMEWYRVDSSYIKAARAAIAEAQSSDNPNTT